jgi:hypothetical protein
MTSITNQNAQKPELPLSKPTVRWAEKTKNRKLILAVKAVALAAFTALGLALTLCTPLIVGAYFIGPVTQAFVFAGLAAIGTTATYMTPLLGYKLGDWKDYSNPKTARKIIQKVRAWKLQDLWNPKSLKGFTRQGFISKQNTKKADKLCQDYLKAQDEFYKNRFDADKRNAALKRIEQDENEWNRLHTEIVEDLPCL